ncbi:MAG: glycerol-3-phosphate 1-O-acyltransferase PlsY [Eubacteriales bacterium]|nr:glycerol-3-phosphate 1-O-acyltransferase PlsY [Eubacteriales bacterium]
MDVIRLIASSLSGYFLGSANTSLIVGKIYGTDVRKHGSGNAGMTNTLRILGKLPALLVVLGDVLKGILACYLGAMIAGYPGMLLGGFFAVIGHNWPAYFRFKGGKGALTSITVIFYIDWKIGLIVTSVFLAVFALSRYVSLGSIAGALALTISAVVMRISGSGNGLMFVIFSILISALVILRHKENIKRLLSGTEAKLGMSSDRKGD